MTSADYPGVESGYVLISLGDRDLERPVQYLAEIKKDLFSDATMVWSEDLKDAIFFETLERMKLEIYQIWAPDFIKKHFEFSYAERPYPT